METELSSKIIDESHFKFHVECKAKIINAVGKLKSGIGVLDTLSKLNFSTDKAWTKNTCNDPIVKVLLDILEDYKKVEHRPTRAKLLIPLIEYGIGLIASDLYYKERGEWWLSQIIKRSPEMHFHDTCIDPAKWYPLMRNNGTVQGENGDYYKAENDPDATPIEQEYIRWYGIDPMSDMTDIPEELKQKVIAENVAWMKQNAAIEYAVRTNDTKLLNEEIKKITGTEKE